MKGRNMNKRVISLLLVFCMILGLFPTTTYAAEQSSTQVVSSEMLSSETQEEKEVGENVAGLVNNSSVTEESSQEESENTAGENELGNSTLEEDNEEKKEADESIAGSENNSSVTVEPSQEESKSTADENELEDSALKEDSDSSSKAKVKDAPLQEKLSKNVAIMSLEAGTADSGVTFELSRINVQAENAGVYELAQAQFEAKGKNVSLVYNEVTSVNDIIVNPKGNSDTYGEEGYSITVDSGVVTVTAATNAGAFYGLQNVLQQLEKGSVSDVETTQPYKGTRSLFVDCGRKYFSVSWFEEMIREMSWNGMNTLYLSFSNDEGFRFLLDDMSLSFDDGNGNTITYDDEFMSHIADNPQYLSNSAFLTERNSGASNVAQQISNYDNNKYLSQKDMERILAYAEAYGINVIPEFNSPGHMGQVLWYFPEYRNVGIWGVGSNPCYALNLENVEAKNFATALIKKYVDFFAANGVEDFCVGGDEFASHGSSNDTIASYVNNLVDYVESKGMTAYAWNDGQATASGLLKKSVVVNCWNGSVVDGYSCVNFNGNSFDTHTLYYVLKGHDGWRPDAEWLYSTWTPLDFYRATVDNSDKIAGASLAIWCDNPNYETSDKVLTNMIPNIRAFGYKMWNYSDVAATSLTDEYASYSDFTAAVTDAPEVEAKTVLATVDYVLTEDEGTDDDENTPLPTPSGIGYELVTFNAPTVSTNDGWYYSGNNLIDGDFNTVAWTNSPQDVGDYMRVDLGSVQQIDSITITSPSGIGDVCSNAAVEVSLDGTKWTNKGTYSGNSQSYDINDSIRYIQIVIKEHKVNWWQVSEISWNPRSVNENPTVEDGTYIIVNDTNKAMTSTTAGSGKFAKQEVTIDGDIATPVNSVYEWTFAKQSNGTYYITNAKGQYLQISSPANGGLSTSTSPQAISVEIANGKVMLYNGSYSVNYYVSNGEIFSTYDIERRNNDYHYLYKKLLDGLYTAELYDLITEAEEIDNSDQRYGTAEFERLQSVLTESIELYNDASAEETTVTQDQINEQVEKLQAALSELRLSDTTSNYIEIPVEILDFRADGVLFEYDQNNEPRGAYDLLKAWASDYANLLPGTAASQEGEGSSEVWRRQGLTEENLVDGNLVYTQATVEYVAALINARYYSDLTGNEDSYDVWTHSTVTNWNTNISNKVEQVAGKLGTWADTIAKTSSQANGSYLAWNDITTSTDLAYYVLTNLYRTTESDSTTQYNTKVSSVDRIRMLYDKSTGLYTLDANYQTETMGGYVFNTDLTTATSNNPGNFDPIRGLGYEGSDYTYGDTTDAVHGQNFHFTMHAYGSFVYYADQELYFEFTGDDDVYFYIDGKLAMDIGAAHGPCSDRLRLNDVADDLGLVDGGIYTFDMFYAERHTTASNLKFATNIKIMDTMSTTSKGQYKEATGEIIPYGSIVEEGTTVAYSFELLNLRSVNVIDISFVDESLGSNLSKNAITLYDSAKTNGAETDIADIIVYYNTYDRPAPNQPGTINTSASVEKTFAEMVEMINAASENGYRSLEQGSYNVRIQSEDELKELLELGLPIDTQIQVYGVKRNVTENDRPYVNTITSRAYYVSNGKKVALNGIANQKLTVLKSFSSVADKEQIVIDYGKAVQVNLNALADNLHLNDNVTATFYGITKSGTHNQIRTNTVGINGVAADTAYTTATSNGTYYLRATNGVIDTIEFKLDEMLSEIEKVYVAYKITDAALTDTKYKEYYLLVELDIIPATNVYYETDFADGVFTFADSPSNNENTWHIVSEGAEVVDPVQDTKVIGTDLYGFDSTYTDDAKYSDFDSWKVTGAGNNLTTVNFSFTGTGFDIISQTGENEGIIRVSIYSDAAKTNLVKRVQVLNKSESELTLYQIPVISVENLEHGTYYVNIGVSQPKTDSSIAALNNGGQFHFDAIRIFDPVDVSLAESSTGDALIAYQAYAGDGEANATRYEVRNLLIAANDYDADAGTEGITFVDRFYNSEGIEGVNVTDYAAIGPNNEVYLTRGQAIAFKIQTDRMPASIDLGLKSANGEAAIAKTTLASGTTKEGANESRFITIGSSTTLYYDLANGTPALELFAYNDETGCYEAYVIVTNDSPENSASILSITDLKFGYGLNVQPIMMRFIVARDVMEAADTFMLEQVVEEEEEVYVPKDNILSAKFTSKDCRVNKKATMTVTTTKDVERIEVLNAYGNDECTKIKYKDSKRGTRTWTVELIPLHVGKQTYKVVGYEADGIAGAEVTVSIAVRAPKNILDAKFTSKDCRVNKKTMMTVTTTKDVERIEVLNAYGDDECTKIKQKDSKDGKRTWTVELTPSHVGKQTYKVVGYEADGIAGAEVTVSINVKKK